jgi:hypothetical protein
VDRRDSVAPSLKGEPPEEGKLDIKPDIKSKVSDRTKLRNETIEKIVSDYLMKDPSFGSILKDLRVTKGKKFGSTVNKIWKIVDAIASSKATYVYVKEFPGMPQDLGPPLKFSLQTWSDVFTRRDMFMRQATEAYVYLKKEFEKPHGQRIREWLKDDVKAMAMKDFTDWVKKQVAENVK